MPVYEFKDTSTGEQWEDFMTYQQMKDFLSSNPSVHQVIGAPAIISGVAGITHKTDGGFKDVLSKIAEKNPNTPLADQYGSKSVKETKTRAALEKHKKKMG